MDEIARAIVASAAIVSISVMQSVALATGADGDLFPLSLAAISLLGGLKLGSYYQMKRDQFDTVQKGGKD